MKNRLYTIAASAILFLSPISIFSQLAPNLRTANTFVLFTGTGEFTCNSPSAIVVGDVGNLTGVVTAFPPGFLSGDKHFNDGVATQVSADVNAAYADLAGRACGTVHSVAFGTDEVLTPGVYCAGAASTLDGNITFDGQNNPAAVFIIKIDGAFSSVAGSQIILINQASACNVFWQINGAVALNNTVFKGTMIANGGISLNSGTIAAGRVLATAGALIFGSVITSQCDATVLPLQLVNFDVAKTSGNNVQISWITTFEVNVLRYDVEASINGIAFYKIGTVFSKGNSIPARYNLQDVQFNKTGVRFYRLKMVDKDGAVTYSAIKSVKFSDLRSGLINIFPNPAGKTITISVNAESQQNIILTIINMYGQKVIQKTKTINKGINNIGQDIQRLSKANYVVSIKNISTGEESRQSFQKL